MDKTAVRSLWLRMWMACAAFCAAAVIARLVIANHPALPLRLAVLTAWVGAGCVCLLSIIRALGSADELARRIITESLACAFVVVYAVGFGYGALERNAGLPHLPWVYLPVFMLLAWLIGFFRTWRRFA